jgi:hypothetical protein
VTLAVATALALAAGGAAVVGAASPGASTGDTAPAVDAGLQAGPVPAQADGPDSDSDSDSDSDEGDEGDAFTDCVNGTSRSMLACGYNPGPTAVELESQAVGRVATVRAVDTEAGGFVVIHELSFVDGALRESVVGLSRYLEPGLHTDVTVPVSDMGNGPGRYIAVVYTDDGDRTFEFFDSGGAVDRPYTVRYSDATGNVTDEAGDVIGDTAELRPAPTLGEAPANDLDGDGAFEDVTGDGRVTITDVATLLANLENDDLADGAEVFDFNGDGRFDLVDVATLLRDL